MIYLSTERRNAKQKLRGKKMKKCLLIIKDQSLLDVISMILKSVGYSSLEATTSRESPRLVRSPELELLVVSWNIAPARALPIIEEARQVHPKLPIVTLAGSYSTNEWDTLIPGLQAVPVQTGKFRNFIPSLNKAGAIMSKLTLSFLWDTEAIAETIYQKLVPKEGEEPLARDAFLAEFTKRRKAVVESLASDLNVNMYEVFGLIPGTLLPKGKGRDELIELRFWLDVQKAAL